MAKARLAILISGRGSNMAALIDAARRAECPYEVVLVGSNVPDAPGLAYAAAAGIPQFATSHVGMPRAEFDALVGAALEEAEVGFVALAGYMRLLSRGFVERWSGRIVNIHPSLLPRYPGLDTHRRALDAGDAVAGCSVHIVTPELDAGPVIAQVQVPILPGDDPDALARRVLIEEHKLYPAAVARWIAEREGML